MPSKYFDNAATSFPKPESVYLAVNDAMRKIGASPGRGGYSRSIEASRLLFETREKIAALFGCKDSSRIIITHSATESINIALRGFLKNRDHVITTTMEHNAVARTLTEMQKEQIITVDFVKADANGYIYPDDIKRFIKPTTKLIAVSHISNSFGVIQPIETIAEIAKEHGIKYLVDASQSAGIIPIDLSDLKIDLLAAPGHKALMGPQGTGFLYVSPELDLKPLISGGTGNSSKIEQPKSMPEGFESGTHNLPGIAGLNAALDFVSDISIKAIGKHEKIMGAKLVASLLSCQEVEFKGYSDPSRHSGVVSFIVGDEDPSEFAFELDRRFGIAVRAGLHCSPLSHQTVGTFPQGTIRVSPGWFTKEEDIAFISDAIVQCIKN